MRSVGNTGLGETHAEIHEPRDVVPHLPLDDDGQPVQFFTEIAWHQGRTASATGYEAARRRRLNSARADVQGTARCVTAVVELPPLPEGAPPSPTGSDSQGSSATVKDGQR